MRPLFAILFLLGSVQISIAQSRRIMSQGHYSKIGKNYPMHYDSTIWNYAKNRTIGHDFTQTYLDLSGQAIAKWNFNFYDGSANASNYYLLNISPNGKVNRCTYKRTQNGKLVFVREYTIHRTDSCATFIDRNFQPNTSGVLQGGKKICKTAQNEIVYNYKVVDDTLNNYEIISTVKDKLNNTIRYSLKSVYPDTIRNILEITRSFMGNKLLVQLEKKSGCNYIDSNIYNANGDLQYRMVYRTLKDTSRILGTIYNHYYNNGLLTASTRITFNAYDGKTYILDSANFAKDSFIYSGNVLAQYALFDHTGRVHQFYRQFEVQDSSYIISYYPSYPINNSIANYSTWDTGYVFKRWKNICGIYTDTQIFQNNSNLHIELKTYKHYEYNADCELISKESNDMNHYDKWTFHYDEIPIPDSTFQKLQTLIYPNPAHDEIHFFFGRNMNDLRLEIFDLNGRSIHKDQLATTQEFKLSTHKFAPGIYCYRISSPYESVTGKFIIAK